MAYEVTGSFEIPGFVLGVLLAGDDLSAKQYRFVVGTAGDGVGVASAAGKALGVLRNAPAEGQVCEIVVNGVAEVICDDTVTEFGVVEVGTNGGADDIGAGKGVGMALKAGVVGDIIPVLLKDYGT